MKRRSRRKIFHPSRKGQLALLDGMLFFTIITMACTTLTAYSITNFSKTPDTVTTYRLNYVEIAAKNILSTTVRQVTYFDGSTSQTLYDIQVSDLLLRRLACKAWGYADSMEKDLDGVLKNTSAYAHPDFRCAIWGKYQKSATESFEVFYSNDTASLALVQKAVPRYTYDILREMEFGLPGSATLTFIIWPR